MEKYYTMRQVADKELLAGYSIHSIRKFALDGTLESIDIRTEEEIKTGRQRKIRIAQTHIDNFFRKRIR